MRYSCLGLASGIGAGNKSCGEGPLVLKEGLHKLPLLWERMIIPDNTPMGDPCTQIALLSTQLAKETLRLSQRKKFFLVFGGDHSSAIGTWSGIAEAYRLQGEIGLIWVDAHMDAHTRETSPSGNIHGMPLATLLGYGDARLTSILSAHPKVKPENIALIGIRSYEPGEAQLLQHLGVKIYYIDEVHQRGFSSVLAECIAKLQQQTVGYGISFDWDVIDPAVVGAVGTPVPNGINAGEAMEALSILKAHAPLAVELVEYNPSLDPQKQTLAFVETFLATLLHQIGKHQTVLTRYANM